MKTIFVVLAACLLTVNAANLPGEHINNYEVMVNDILDEMAAIAKNTAVALEQQIDTIVLDPLRQVNEEVDKIESRRDESDKCVSAQEEVVVSVVDGLHDEMNACGIIAAKSSAEITIDVSKATQQLLFGGYDVIKTYQKCQSYKNPVLKNSCYARLTIKATLYANNARKSINTIKKSTNERIPGVFVDADACTGSAADAALVELENVNTNIDKCVLKKN